MVMFFLSLINSDALMEVGRPTSLLILLASSWPISFTPFDLF